ncbi:MAG: hypothetical protein JWQ29_2784 [Phenylobacterium sp.]|nr:hypothetical protein [Phenylobacterium sp.]
MPELAAMLGCSFLGFALIALTQDQHRRRVAGAGPLNRRPARRQQGVAAVLLILSLLIAIWRRGGSFGAMLWLLTLSAGALLVAAALAWRPRLLAGLVAINRGADPETGPGRRP